MSVVEQVPYREYMGRVPSYNRVHEVLDTASGVPELHVEYVEHGWYVYRRLGTDVIGTETSPLGEERVLTDNRSQFIRRHDDMEQNTVLPNLVARWTIHNECLVFQLVAQRHALESVAARVVSTFNDNGPQSFGWRAHGVHWRARALSWHDGVSWVIRFEACSQSGPHCYIPSLVYSRERRAWLLGRDGDVVPRSIARALSNAIGFQRPRDGFS